MKSLAPSGKLQIWLTSFADRSLLSLSFILQAFKVNSDFTVFGEKLENRLTPKNSDVISETRKQWRIVLYFQVIEILT